MDLPKRSPNVIFSQNPGKGPCKAIPLDGLNKGARGRKCSKGIELRLGNTQLICTAIFIKFLSED